MLSSFLMDFSPWHGDEFPQQTAKPAIFT
jgi:hypothetical protein